MDKSTHRRWFQFSLRTLLIVTTLVGCGCGWFVMKLNAAKRQQAAVKLVQDAGGVIRYQDEFDDQGKFLQQSQQAGSPWSRNLLGDDFFRKPTGVWFPSGLNIDGIDSILIAVGQLDELKSLYLSDASISDRTDWATIQSLRQLEHLDLSGTEIGDSGLQNLSANLKGDGQQLKTLNLRDTRVTDAGLKCLMGFGRLEQLDLRSNQYGPKGEEALRKLGSFADLATVDGRITEFRVMIIQDLCLFNEFSQPATTESKLRRIQTMAIDETFVGIGKPLADKERAVLAQIRELLQIAINNQAITVTGVTKLQAALSNCRIEH